MGEEKKPLFREEVVKRAGGAETPDECLRAVSPPVLTIAAALLILLAGFLAAFLSGALGPAAGREDAETAAATAEADPPSSSR